MCPFEMADDSSIFRTLILEKACITDLSARSFLGNQLDCGNICLRFRINPWVYCSKQFDILQPNLHSDREFAGNLLFRLRSLCPARPKNNDSKKPYPTSTAILHQLMHDNCDINRVPKWDTGQVGFFVRTPKVGGGRPHENQEYFKELRLDKIAIVESL